MKDKRNPDKEICDQCQSDKDIDVFERTEGRYSVRAMLCKQCRMEHHKNLNQLRDRTNENQA